MDSGNESTGTSPKCHQCNSPQILHLTYPTIRPGSPRPLTPAAEHIVASLNHLRRDKLHEDVKPYKLQYDPGPELPRTNCVNETREGIVIHDLRCHMDDFSFEKNGFDVIKIISQLPSEEFYDKARVQEVFYEEIEEALSQYFSETREIVIMEHQVQSYL